MPELAEVEYYRKLWDAGLRQPITRVHIHGGKRVTRGIEPLDVVNALTGAKLLSTEARAKQMLFRFSGDAWIGLHLGMTGELSVAAPHFAPEKHDHFVLFQKKQALVFRDPRQFGRVRFHQGELPEWWTSLPPAITSPQFTLQSIRDFLERRSKIAIKAALLMQEQFPGVGNWMADEILWRAKLLPTHRCGDLTAAQIRKVWQETRAVCEEALATVGLDLSGPPKGWFFHARWTSKGKCPRCKSLVETAQVGGRTTRWCPRCQR